MESKIGISAHTGENNFLLRSILDFSQENLSLPRSKKNNLHEDKKKNLKNLRNFFLGQVNFS